MISQRFRAGSRVPLIALNSGAEVPQLGFGVFQIAPERAQAAVEAALEAGYRHLDTAAAYNNEAAVGAAIRASGIARDEIFVTTKLRNGEQGYDSALAAFDAANARLGLGYVDLYLIHWPSPARDAYLQSWRALETLLADGRVRSIGVSNFLRHHLERLLAGSNVIPAINQVERHPAFQQRDVCAFSRSAGIHVEAYSPLGQGTALTSPVIVALALRHGVTPAQIVVRWQLQHDVIVIPKTVDPVRMRENLDVFGFELSAEEIADIDALETGERIGNDPDTFEIAQIR